MNKKQRAGACTLECGVWSVEYGVWKLISSPASPSAPIWRTRDAEMEMQMQMEQPTQQPDNDDNVWSDFGARLASIFWSEFPKGRSWLWTLALRENINSNSTPLEYSTL